MAVLETVHSGGLPAASVMRQVSDLSRVGAVDREWTTLVASIRSSAQRGETYDLHWGSDADVNDKLKNRLIPLGYRIRPNGSYELHPLAFQIHWDRQVKD